jgi:hypothetical protein
LQHVSDYSNAIRVLLTPPKIELHCSKETNGTRSSKKKVADKKNRSSPYPQSEVWTESSSLKMNFFDLLFTKQVKRPDESKGEVTGGSGQQSVATPALPNGNCPKAVSRDRRIRSRFLEKVDFCSA